MLVGRHFRKSYLLLANKLQKNKYKVFLFGSISFSCIILTIGVFSNIVESKAGASVLGTSVERMTDVTIISPVAAISDIPTPTNLPTPTNSPTPVPTLPPKNAPKIIPSNSPTPVINPGQYTAEKLNDVTWRVKNIENDDRMASAQDIVNGINNYRNAHGLGNLIVDGFLTSYAQDRANLFASNGGLDSHAGFQNFMSNGGFDKAGFNSLGENSAYVSGPMSADKIVRNIFGADASHDSNQLDNWTHVGVGVNGVAINVNFGKNKK